LAVGQAVPSLVEPESPGELAIVPSLCPLQEGREDYPPAIEGLAVAIGDIGRRERSVGRFVIEQGESELFEVRDALGGAGVLPPANYGPDEPSQERQQKNRDPRGDHDGLDCHAGQLHVRPPGDTSWQVCWVGGWRGAACAGVRKPAMREQDR